MASSSRAGAQGPVNEKANAMYDYCLKKIEEDDHSVGLQLVFRQEELLGTNIIPENDLMEFMAVVQRLLDDRRFKAVQDIEGLGWRVRTKEDAKKYLALLAYTPEHEIVYTYIDEAGAEGIWQRNLKNKSGVNDTKLSKICEKLRTLGYIRRLMSVEHKNQIQWIKENVKASERVVGGAWHTDGDLDTVFVATICKVILRYLKRKTFYVSGAALRAPKKSIKRSAPYPPPKGRDRTLDIEDSEKAKVVKEYDAHLPFPPDYDRYPTLPEITKQVLELKITKDVVLQSKEIKQLLDIMILDGDIELVLGGGSDGKGYKATRKALRRDRRIDVGSVFNEAPCGRCPVFEICEEGGPVAPSSCQYLQEWLE